MPLGQSRNASRVASNSGPWTALGVALALLFFLISGAAAYLNIQVLKADNEKIEHSHEVIAALDSFLSTIQDAETGQRGFLLSGNESYLQPYNDALANVALQLGAIASLTEDNKAQQTNLGRLKPHVDAKLAELKQTIDLSRAGNRTAALAVVASDRGKIEMDAIRARLSAMDREEGRLRDARLAEMQGAYRTAGFSGVLATLLGMALTLGIGVLIERSNRTRRRQAWLHTGHVGVAEAMLGDKSVRQLADSILDYLAPFLGAQAAVLYKREAEGMIFHRTAQLGVPADAAVPDRFILREGLLGRVAADGRPIVLHDIPEGYLTVGSALGRNKPRHLVIAPLSADGVVNAVIELGFLYPVDERIEVFLDQIAGSAGIALRSARYRMELQNLLEETQRQSEELQSQSEELRVSNEELEEQSRALKEQQARLEQQQVELEQTNSQLEEQAQMLETQRDDLVRTGAAVELKARELEQASRYKSDFLANMSHELRTPLNSLLILSRLLGDNPNGALSDEQVQYARTIESAGNDLLNLINDILDLSKIEAGHVDVHIETVSLQRLASDLRQTFDPVAGQRRLEFAIDIDADCPATIASDRQRLEQILKNLLSNAFKFTEAGKVALRIERAGPDSLSLAVTDSGIGISPEQHRAIFEAFRQADGAINRKYGGTGLGLSISRELARLLGGSIDLESEAGKGSTFTLTIPLAYDSAHVAVRADPPSPADPVRIPALAPRALATSFVVEDDRDNLEINRRILLVAEDDATFAGIVRDLAREAGFQCLVAGTAEDALALAKRYRPSALILDVGLPDQSGLAVLDRLKHDPATRHIPIHVVSAADHSQTALSLGAVGYLAKPVKREDLAHALQSLEAQLTRTVRRVLIVEDDAVQREAVGKLLAAGDVQTISAGTAAECLRLLNEQTFDCMVLDLSLPDASGFSLLETLSAGADYAFPPVIVYTGHDLSSEDEQKLRRYSNSIIVKGAKSPERLLDEVSLFLHQVVSELPPEQQKMIHSARNRDALLEGRRILIVEDDVRNVYSLTNILEPRGAVVEIARNGQEALDALDRDDPASPIELVLMDVMMPVMDGLEATRRIRTDARWTKLPIIMLTAKAMPDDQERCLAAGGNDYMSKPLDVDKLLSLVRVWMPR